MSAPAEGGRVNQKRRTRNAIVDACRDLIKAGGEVTMPEVARSAQVSEATAYRYFPDLISVMREAFAGVWPDPSTALQPVPDSAGPSERVAYATEVLMRGVLAYQGAARAVISAAITRPDPATIRPGYRFDLIDSALAPFHDGDHAIDATTMAQLKLDLALIVSAEALFTLIDLCGLAPEQAVASAVRTARVVTDAATRRHT